MSASTTITVNLPGITASYHEGEKYQWIRMRDGTQGMSVFGTPEQLAAFAAEVTRCAAEALAAGPKPEVTP